MTSSPTGEDNAAVFMGNFTLFVALLSGIFLVHVALASGVEAYWLAKVRMVTSCCKRIDRLLCHVVVLSTREDVGCVFLHTQESSG